MIRSQIITIFLDELKFLHCFKSKIKITKPIWHQLNNIVTLRISVKCHLITVWKKVHVSPFLNLLKTESDDLQCGLQWIIVWCAWKTNVTLNTQHNWDISRSCWLSVECLLRCTIRRKRCTCCGLISAKKRESRIKCLDFERAEY